MNGTPHSLDVDSRMSLPDLLRAVSHPTGLRIGDPPITLGRLLD